MVRTPLQVFRGNEADMPALLDGEFGAALDTGRLFIGTPAGNSQVAGGMTTPYGARLTPGYSEELIAVAGGVIYTDSAGLLLPAASVIDAVLARVVAAVAGAPSMSVGRTDGNAFPMWSPAGTFAPTLGATAICMDRPTTWAGQNYFPYFQAAAGKVRLTFPNQNPSDSNGRVRVSVFWRQFTPPTS